MKRKTLSLMLAVLLSLQLIPTGAFAATVTASGKCGTNLTWSLTSDGALSITGSGAMYDYERNGAPWYSYRSSIKTVTFGSSVTYIGEYAFQSCSAITSVSMGSRIASIGADAFLLCTKLTSISLPSSLTTIGDSAFYSSGLTSLTIPASVTSIGDRAFFNSDIATLTVASGNERYRADSNVLFELHKDASVTARTLLYYPENKTSSSYSVPATVEKIAPYAFYDNQYLRTLSFGSTSYLTEIGEGAFQWCAYLTTVSNLPTSLRTIGAYAFYDNKSLTSVAYKGTSTLWNKYVSVGSSNTSLSGKVSYGTATHPDHPICGLTCTCTHTHHLPTSWYSWGGTGSIGSSSYYLSKDVTRESWYYINGNVRICLNGHTIETNGEAPGFYIQSGGLLVLADCAGGGTLSSDDGSDNISSSSARAIYNEGTLNLYGGSLYGDDAIYNEEGATLQMYGGAVEGSENGLMNMGNANLYGGSLDGWTSIFNWYDGVCKIDGATIYSPVDNSSDMTIDSGSVIISDGSWGYDAIGNSGTMTINDVDVSYINGSYGNAVSNSGTLHLNGGTLPSTARTAYGSTTQYYSLYNQNTSYTRTYISGSPDLEALYVSYPNTLYFASSAGSKAYSGKNDLLLRVNPSNFGSYGTVAANVTPALYNRITQINSSGEPSDEDGTLSLSGTNLMFAKYIANGQCGDNLYWRLDGNGRLTIYGTGDMYEYSSYTSVPWYNYRTQIKAADIRTGCTYISSYAFISCQNMTSLTLGESEMTMGDYVFEFCDSLTEVTIPANVQLGYGAFLNCSGLRSVSIACPTIPKYAFELCTALESVEIKEGVTTVVEYAFRRTDALREITFPESVTTITGPLFANNSLGSPQLQDITFLNHKTEIPGGLLNYLSTTGITIHGEACSTARRFAEANNIAFEALAGKVNHTPGESVIENEVTPTCGKEGSYDEVIYCSVCTAEVSRTTHTIDKLTTHTPDEPVRENEVPASCKDEGSYDEVVYCSVCTAEVSRTTHTIDKLTTHTPDEPVRENEVPASCKNEGSYDEVVYCSVCTAEVSRTTHTTDKLTTHTPDEPVRENEVPASCTEAKSFDSVIYCTVCEIELSRSKETEGEALGHSWDAWGVRLPAGYLHNGLERRDCSICDHFEERSIPATGPAVAAGISAVIDGNSIIMQNVPEDLVIIAAAYCNGQFVAVKLSGATAGTNRTLFLPDLEPNAVVKLFFLNAFWQPIADYRPL